jgi:hypothetical protein
VTSEPFNQVTIKLLLIMLCKVTSEPNRRSWLSNLNIIGNTMTIGLCK